MSSKCEMNFIACIFQNVNSQDVGFQLRFTLYDAANKCFFGSTWLGPYFSSSAKENGRHSLTCDEVKIVVIYICKCAHSACKESRVRLPGASGFYCWAGDFCS